MRDRTNIQLGEGNTPLIRLYNIERLLGWQGKLWAKCEYQNPTGSFKDRGSVAEIREAIRQKKDGVVCASTGNMAASLSAYAAKAGLPCIVVVPDKTPQSKLQQSIIAGAQISKATGNYDTCVVKAEQIAREKNYLLCGDYKVRRIGQRSIGKELAKSKLLFDGYICPVGNGTVGTAIAEGFAACGKFPSFIGVQGVGADPLSQTFNKAFSPIVPLKNPKTVASAMCVGNPLDGEITLAWIRKTKGCIFSATDSEILKAQKLLAGVEGIYVEPAAAAALAALYKMKNKKQTIVLILTGSGLKTSLDVFENLQTSADQKVLHQSLPFAAV